MVETDHQQRALHRNLQTQVTSAARAPLPSALCPRGASKYGWLSGSPQSPTGSQESGPAHQPTSVLLPWQEVQRADQLRASWLPPTGKPSKAGRTFSFPFSVAARSPVRLLVEANAAGTNKQPLDPVLDVLLPKFSSEE